MDSASTSCHEGVVEASVVACVSTTSDTAVAGWEATPEAGGLDVSMSSAAAVAGWLGATFEAGWLGGHFAFGWLILPLALQLPFSTLGSWALPLPGSLCHSLFAIGRCATGNLSNLSLPWVQPSPLPLPLPSWQEIRASW